MEITISFSNDNPNTIWNKLATKLGREPTHAEAAAEVQRIIRESPKIQSILREARTKP